VVFAGALKPGAHFSGRYVYNITQFICNVFIDNIFFTIDTIDTIDIDSGLGSKYLV